MEGRRIGKTSVAVAALDRIRRQGGRVAVAVLTRFEDPQEVARFLAKQLQSRPRRTSESVVDVLRALDRGSAGELLEDDAAAEVGLATGLARAALNERPDVPELLSGVDAATQTAVLLDEAHAIVQWPTPLQRALNATLRGELPLGVVIASSDSEALQKLTQRDGPLHLVGSRVSLPIITAGHWIGALRDRFAELEIEITETTIAHLIEFTDGHPYLTMRLARDSARIASEQAKPWKVGGAELEAALYELRRDPVWSALHADSED